MAEIYNSKTGIEVDTLRGMMTKETWFTGREALEKGFADAIKEDEDDPEMSMSADRKVLFVNGVRHNVDGLQHVPGTIPVKAIATPPAAKPGANKKKPTAKAAKKEGGNKLMDEKELRQHTRRSWPRSRPAQEPKHRTLPVRPWQQNARESSRSTRSPPLSQISSSYTTPSTATTLAQLRSSASVLCRPAQRPARISSQHIRQREQNPEPQT